MKKPKLKLIMTVFMCILLSLSLAGCEKEIDMDEEGEEVFKPGNKKDDDELICGGRTTKIDDKAPKEIKSKDITEFSASFSLNGDWQAEDPRNRDWRAFTFTVKADENGDLIACEETDGVSMPADEKLLTGLQEAIDKNDLVKRNGVYDVTAGLPPEYQRCDMEVTYRSGEVLYFAEDNNPLGKWQRDICKVFMDWFADNGNDFLLPPLETSKISRIDITFREGSIIKWYSGITVDDNDAIDGETYLFGRSVYDYDTKSSVSDDYVKFPKDYYDRITEILSKYRISQYKDVPPYANWRQDEFDSDPDSDDLKLEIYIEYEDGSILNIRTSKQFVFDEIRPILDEVLEYQDSLFE
ncbi:MAG: hypothetical protein K6G69_00400 [Lachnospiraceae bacterium]|nr:hypothetical protein [Lachnospiraceae bacterium]